MFLPIYVKTAEKRIYTQEVSRNIYIIIKKFYEFKLLLHPVAAGELSFGEILA